jgi:hypothetical protein
MMKSLKIIALFIFFMLIICFKGYSQETQTPAKTIYKITPRSKQVTNKTDVKNLPQEKKSIYSCETNESTHQIIVSTKDKNGVITKETYELKEDNK